MSGTPCIISNTEYKPLSSSVTGKKSKDIFNLFTSFSIFLTQIYLTDNDDYYFILKDFIAESMCGILDTHQPPRCYNWDFVPLPELVLFVEKVTAKAKVDV